MGMIETVYLFKGEERITVNRGDEARFEADGWKPKAEPVKQAELEPQRPKGSGKKG